MAKDFPTNYDHMRKLMANLGKEIPETMTAFTELHECNAGDGVLSCKYKELIALGIAIAVHCDGCIAFHIHDAIKAGASRAEISEAIGVAVLMGGGPSVMYGCEALEALDQFEAVLA